LLFFEKVINHFRIKLPKQNKRKIKVKLNPSASVSTVKSKNKIKKIKNPLRYLLSFLKYRVFQVFKV